jgi:hypothetical protein
MTRNINKRLVLPELAVVLAAVIGAGACDRGKVSADEQGAQTNGSGKKPQSNERGEDCPTKLKQFITLCMSTRGDPREADVDMFVKAGLTAGPCGSAASFDQYDAMMRMLVGAPKCTSPAALKIREEAESAWVRSR